MARDFPWRRTADPYEILISEVMLQQTQADRVIPHYERFIDTFPTVEDLAAAELERILDVWKGLGYNRRALWLRDAARLVVAEGWPSSARDLERLPGVGPYTAAAVASFAFGEETAVVDTNVRRVVSRWVGRPLAGNELAAAATEALEPPASEWNQAVMELGAAVCRPTPRCAECPVTAWCVDPSVYEPPPRQSRFEGSRRQVRGALLRRLSAEWMPLDTVALNGSWDTATVEAAANSLQQDGLVELSGGRVRLAD